MLPYGMALPAESHSGTQAQRLLPDIIRSNDLTVLHLEVTGQSKHTPRQDGNRTASLTLKRLCSLSVSVSNTQEPRTLTHSSHHHLLYLTYACMICVCIYKQAYLCLYCHISPLGCKLLEKRDFVSFQILH